MKKYLAILALTLSTQAFANEQITKRGKHTVSCVPFSLEAIKQNKTWIERGHNTFLVCRIISIDKSKHM